MVSGVSTRPPRVSCPLVFAPEASASLLGYALRTWNPVLELHQSLRLCRPPPDLLGQRDVKLKCGRKLAPPPALFPRFSLNRPLFTDKVRDHRRHACVKADHIQHAASFGSARVKPLEVMPTTMSEAKQVAVRPAIALLILHRLARQTVSLAAVWACAPDFRARTGLPSRSSESEGWSSWQAMLLRLPIISRGLCFWLRDGFELWF